MFTTSSVFLFQNRLNKINTIIIVSSCNYTYLESNNVSIWARKYLNKKNNKKELVYRIQEIDK